MTRRFDIAIVGAGMAGASLAAAIGGRARVGLIEAEAQPGYHATGRSAAFWSETYGGPLVQPLTSASGPWLAREGLLGPRGGLHLAAAGREAGLDALQAAFAGTAVALERLDAAAVRDRLPGVRAGWTAAVAEPTCQDIDVAALHARYLAEARRAGTVTLCDAGVTGITREAGVWRIATRAGEIAAAMIVNAAGAWATPIAALAGAQPIVVTPFRRTVAQLAVAPAAPAGLPLVIDIDGTFYFKPEAGGRIWLSPHDEHPVPAGDVAPEDLDVAIAIDRLERVVDWRVLRRERAWAGLRSFAPDRVPVYGFDARMPGFFWFAGQGGFGIQTAPAAAWIGAALLLGDPLPAEVADIDVARYAPGRYG